MKVAFVGKGGSGKSTMSSLFIQYLNKKKVKDVLALDADLNMNLGGLLGVKVPVDKHLSSPENSASFRRYLKGGNALIRDENAFLPTTPPGAGSNLIANVADKGLEPYAISVNQNPPLSLITVGTYVAEDIGQACYHTNLFVAENLLTHIKFTDDTWVVGDMVAGTDAFSYSLFLQFDAIVLIAEPTPESAEVCNLYFGLARDAGIENLIHVIANKVEDEGDAQFIKNAIGRDVTGCVPVLPGLRKFRQTGGIVTPEMVTDELCAIFDTIYQAAHKPSPDARQRFDHLQRLHDKLCTSYWVISGYGEDVKYQYGQTLPEKMAG